MMPAARQRSKVLGRLQYRLAAWLMLAAGLAWVGTLGTAALGLIVADAALDLSETVRSAAPGFLGLLAVCMVAASVIMLRRLTEVRLARRFERLNPELGNVLTNAAQLAGHESITPVAECLRREAVELGRKTSTVTHPWPVARRRVLSAAAWAAAAALTWGATALLSAEMLRQVLPRWLDPHGDHPPYSALKIEVRPQAAEVVYGGQLEVRATANGRPADKLWLVMRAGAQTTRAIMFLAPDKTFFQTLANLREPAEYFVTDGHARSHRYPVRIRYTPQITLVEVTTVWPGYTGIAAKTTRLAGEPQTLPAGTRLSFRVASNRPLKAGTLFLTPVLGGKSTEVALKAEAEKNMVMGSFTLEEPVAFAISVRDVDGLDCAEPPRGRFNILPDERPRLHVLEPGRNAVATPSIRVPVRVQADDDYAVERVVWLRGHNQSVERPFPMKLALKNGPRSVEAAGAFDLAKLGVRPGDVIDYYFEAADNYPQGPNITLSRPYRLEIISQEQYEQILRMAAARKALFEPYFKLGAWLRRLAERARGADLKSRSETAAGQQQAQRTTQELAEDLRKYEDELGKLLNAALMFDVEQAFREHLVVQLTRVAEARKKIQGAPGGGKLDPKTLAELAAELEALSGSEQEEVGEPAARIAEVARVLAKAGEFIKLARQQAALAQLLRRFADKIGSLTRSEQMELRELAHQQQRVREGLRAMLTALPELLSKVPAQPQYGPLRKDVEAFVEAIAQANIEGDLAAAVEALERPDTANGHLLAQRAADAMDKLISKCGGLPQEGKLCLRFKPSVQKALGNTLEQILAAMGASSGMGDGGRDGYSLFNEDAALYGPNMELAGEQGAGRDLSESANQARATARVPGAAREPDASSPQAPGRVRLQPDAKFPLRYRELVGEYFRAIAESGAVEGGKK